ncbi:MAG TPA: ethylbenzene dehydrogenase-related protein [Chitinophagaceae bacterium]
MKLFQKKSFWVLTSFVLFIGYWVSCTKHDQILQQGTTSANGTTLVSQKVTTAPTIDGTIDASWANATKLNITPQVPDPGNNLFTGYIGQQYSATLRSMYDANNIYFLLEIADATQSINVTPWFFDPTQNVTGKTGWVKEPSSKSFDVNGVLVRDGFGEDKFAMLFNIDNSTPKFITQTCYGSCHIFTPYVDYSVTPSVPKSNASSGNHYTNGVNEKIDMWWGRLGYMSRDASLNFVDDNYQDWAGGPGVTNLVGGSGNGRHVDGISVSGANTTWPFAPTYTTSPTQGEVGNTQSLKLDGTGASVSVPLWVVPNASTNFILVSDTTGGKAKKVTAVSSLGVLTLSDGSTIDPNVGTDYKRTGDAITGLTALKAIPANIAVPLIGPRADISGTAVYTGGGWIVECKRALKTSDALKQDVDFSSLQDQPFGLAYWNKSNYQHGIQPNLLLKFQQ